MRSPRDIGSVEFTVYFRGKDALLLKHIDAICEMSGLSRGKVISRILKVSLYNEEYGECLDLLPNEVDTYDVLDCFEISL